MFDATSIPATASHTLRWLTCLIVLAAASTRAAEPHRPTAEADVRHRRWFDPGLPEPPRHLCIQFHTAQGASLTLYADRGKPMPLGVSATAAFRTRAVYRFSLRVGRDEAEQDYHGTIDVIRAPHFPEDIDPREAAIPVAFDDEDITQLIRDRMITKFIVLEDPEKALDFQSTESQPIRYESTFDRDPVKRAKELGKILIVVRVGNRIPSESDWASVAPGALLVAKNIEVRDAKGAIRNLRPEFVDSATYPQGDVIPVSFGCAACAQNHCGPAAAGVSTTADSSECQAPLPPTSGPGVDPRSLLNNDMTYNFEYLCDGGDRRPRVGWVMGGEVVNINPEDTVAEYRPEGAGKRIAVSNRVCLFAPRYVEVRTLQMADGYDATDGYAMVILERKPNQYVDQTRRAEKKLSQGPELVLSRKQLRELVGTQWSGDLFEVRVLAGLQLTIGWASIVGVESPEELTNVVAPVVLKRVQCAQELSLDQALQIVGMIAGTGEVKSIWTTREIRRVDLREPTPTVLKLEKSADRDAARIGDEITFAIRYTNLGKLPITSIAITDSLTTRLDYVLESAQSERDAIFTAGPNESGSTMLHWEIKAPLGPGESGTVTFKARVR